MPKYLSIGLSVAILLIFGYTLLQNALNAPSFDDYDTTVNFIRRYFFEHFDVATRLKVLLSRQNEHRIVISKGLAAAYYSLSGEINFRSLVLIQNLFLPAFFILMLAIMKAKGLLSAATVLWAAVFLFSLAFWQVTFYYWGGIQHYTVFFFSFLALYMLDKSQRIVSSSFFIALLAGTLAVVSFGNGFLAVLLGSFLLFAQKKRGLWLCWTTFAVLLILVTFFPRPGSASETIPFNWGWMARLLFTFLGSFFYINPPVGLQINIIWCMAVGVAVLVTWLWLLFSGYAFRAPLLYALLSLPVLTGIIIAVSRFETKAAGGIAPRYMFFTASIPVLLLIILLDLGILKKQYLGWLTGLGVLLWGVVFYNNRQALVKNNTEIVATLQRWKNDHNTPLIYYKQSGEYSQILEWAVSQNVVRIPSDHVVNR